MPRRGFVPKREVLDDPIYGGKLVTKLVNQVMLDGKRGTAQKACYGAFDIIKDKTGREPLEVFEEARSGSQSPPRGRRYLSGTYRDPSRAPSDPWPSLAGKLCPRPQRAHHAGAPCR